MLPSLADLALLSTPVAFVVVLASLVAVLARSRVLAALVRRRTLTAGLRELGPVLDTVARQQPDAVAAIVAAMHEPVRPDTTRAGRRRTGRHAS